MRKTKLVQLLSKYRNDIMSFFFFFVVVTVFYSGLIRRSYNADTMTYMVYFQDDAQVRVFDGRYLIALIDLVLYQIHIKPTDYMPVFTIMAMILLAVTMVLLKSVFEKFRTAKGTLHGMAFDLSVSLVFCNVLYIEYFMFSEVTLFYIFGYFLATVGMRLLTGNKRLAAFFLFLLAVCTYQLSIVYAAISLLFYYMLENDFKWSKKAVTDEIIACVIPLSTGVINMTVIQIVGRINDYFVTRKSYTTIGVVQKSLMLLDSFGRFLCDSYTLLPRLWIPGIVLCLSVVLGIYVITKTRDAFGALFFAAVVFGSILAIFLIPFLEEGASDSPRMTFCLYLVQGMIFITDIYLLSAFGKENLLKGASAVVFAFVWLQMVAVSFIVPGRYISNTLDKNYSQIILKEIEKYEERTGNAVTKMCVVNDEHAPAYYEESRNHFGQINERIMGQTTRSMFEAFWNRHFDYVGKMPAEVYDEYFAGKNWDYFDVNEQLVIIDDTAYLCVY